MKKFAFIIKTNEFNDFKKYVFKTWIDNLPEDYDAFIMFDKTYNEHSEEHIGNLISCRLVLKENVIVYDEKTFLENGFPIISRDDLLKTNKGKDIANWYGGNTMLIYNMAYQEPYFFKLHPDYERYFVIEDDILFNGDYSLLFETVEKTNVDFLPINIYCDAKED